MHFTEDELNYTKAMLTGLKFEEKGATPFRLDVLLGKLDTIKPGKHYATFYESTEEDVLMVIENMEDDEGNSTVSTLNEEDVKQIIYKVMEYDCSDYNEYIQSVIEEYK